MLLKINLTILFAIIVILLLRRRVAPRTRFDTTMTALTVLVLGILIAPSALGHSIMQFVDQIARSLSRIGT